MANSIARGRRGYLSVHQQTKSHEILSARLYVVTDVGLAAE